MLFKNSSLLKQWLHFCIKKKLEEFSENWSCYGKNGWTSVQNKGEGYEA